MGAPMSPAIPVVVCVDVEPDGRPPAPLTWRGAAAAAAFFAPIRRELRDATGHDVRLSWFCRLDDEIVREAHPAAAFDAIRAAVQDGDEVGLHVHPYRWDGGTWCAEYADESWIDGCLDRAFRAFREVRGAPCASFRFGDHYMSHAVLARLRREGVHVDVTLEPGLAAHRPQEHLLRGAVPAQTGLPRGAYRPDPHDFRRPEGADGPWFLPVSTGVLPAPVAHLPAGAWTSARLPLPTPVVLGLVRQCLDALPVPHLVLPLRSHALAQPERARRIRDALRGLRAVPEAARLRFVTPADAVRMVTAPAG